jgi:hypothetical protein
MLSTKEAITTVSFCLLLAACGGGGGGDDSTPTDRTTNNGSIGNNADSGSTTTNPTSGSSGSGSPSPTIGTNTGGATSPPAGSTNTGGTTSPPADGTNTGGVTSPPAGGTNTANPTPGFEVDATARLNDPRDITVDQAGNVYVMTNENQIIRKISPMGEVSTIPGVHPSWSMVGDSLGNLFLLSSDPSEDVLIRDAIEIHRVTPTREKTLVHRHEIKPGSFDPREMATDGLGRVYVLTQYRNIHAVLRIDPDGTTQHIYRGIGFSSNLASNEQGDLAFNTLMDRPAPYDDPRIVFVPESAHMPVEPVPYDYSAPGVTSEPLQESMYGETLMAANRDMYFIRTVRSADEVNALRITKVASDGTTTVIFDGFPDRSTTARATTSEDRRMFRGALAANGDFYISDPYVHAIYKITSAGQASLVAGKPGEPGNSD